MNELDLVIDENEVVVTEPFASSSSMSLFNENVEETFSSVAAYPVTLPPGLVYVSDKQGLVIFERPPGYKTITYNTRTRDSAIESANKSVTVPIPWQVYIGEFGTNGILNALHFYFASGEIIGLDIPNKLLEGSVINLKFAAGNRLYMAPLPNIYDSNLVCLDKETYHPENPNLASKINLMYASVWDTVFNADIVVNIQKQLEYLNNPIKKLSGGYKVTPIETFMQYWSKISLNKALRLDKDSKTFFQPVSTKIALSEFFTSSSNYKFFNTLQAIL
jgi:hypothetical protein